MLQSPVWGWTMPSPWLITLLPFYHLLMVTRYRCARLEMTTCAEIEVTCFMRSMSIPSLLPSFPASCLMLQQFLAVPSETLKTFYRYDSRIENTLVKGHACQGARLSGDTHATTLSLPTRTPKCRSDRFTFSKFGLHCLTTAASRISGLVYPRQTGRHFTPNAVSLLRRNSSQNSGGTGSG